MDDGSSSVSGPHTEHVLIGCEGNFQFSNASISILNKESGEVANSAFFEKNDRELGDVLQSISQWGDTVAVVVNNSGEVLFCKVQDLEIIGSVSGLQSPRYLQKVGTQFWVTDLYSNEITLIEGSTLEVSETISMDGWSERLAPYLRTVLVANLEERSVESIDIDTRQVQRLLSLDFVPRYLGVYDSLLVLSGEEGTINAPGSRTVIQTYDLRRNLDAERWIVETPYASAAADFEDGYLYVLHSDKVSAVDLLASEIRSFSHQAETPYGIGIDAENEQLYICDAIDFISEGLVYRWETEGNFIDTIHVQGYIPQSILPLF